MAPRNAHSLRTAPEYLRFQDGGGLSKEAVMEAIARQRAAAGGQSGGGSGTAPQTQPQTQPQQPSMLRDFLRNPGSVLRERERATGLRFQDGGQLRGNPVGEYMRRVGEEWSQSNADFEGSNPGVMQRIGRAVNPLTGLGSSVGAMYDAAGSGDVTGMALAAGSSIPVFAAARTVKTVAGPRRVASIGGTAVRAGKNTAFGVGADYYTPGLQDGGVVPGTGRGDKIPAKYEPGEFVVSNDMIDDNPGLREQLSGLRAETLAARGKTVEEADAQALNGGRRPSLRAQAGFNGSADPDFWRGNPNPLQGNQANQTLLDAARQRIDPVQTAARGSGAPVPEGPAVRPTAPLSPEAAAAYDASPEGRATKVQVLKDTRGYFQGEPRAAAAPTGASAPTAPAAPGATPSAAKPGLVARAVGATGSGLRTAAGFAAKAGNAVGGTVGAVQSLRDINTGYRDHFAQSIGAEDAGPGWAAATDTFRTAANIGNALTGGLAESLGRGISDYISGGSFQEGWKQPTSRDAFEAARERPAGQSPAGQSPAGQSPAAPDTRNPYADANAAKIAASDAQNKAAAAAQPTAQPRYTNDVTRNGNEYSGTNVAGDITINGQQPGGGGGGGGISPQNMAAADALAQRDALRSMGVVASQQQQAPMPPSIASPRPLTSHELRNLKVSAESIVNTEKWGGKGADKHPDVIAYQNAMNAHIAQRYGMDPGTIARTQAQASMYGSQASADASRYTSDNSLRGDMFKTAATERSTRATAATAAEKYWVERRDKATERLDKVFASYATGKDGKTDERQLADLRNNAQAFLDSATEAARKRGDMATVEQLSIQGLAALADDPGLMRRYIAANKADRIARGSWGGTYNATDNPGGRRIAKVQDGKVHFSDGTTAPRAKIEYADDGVLPHRFADWDPFASRTTEFDALDPRGALRKVTP